MFGFFRDIPVFLRSSIQLRSALGQLVARDFKERYLGSYLGFLWPFIQQLLMTLIMGFVLETGMRVTPVSGQPFLAWLIVAQSIFFFFNEAVTSSTSVFLQYSYLVKKVQFRISLLPLVKILTAMVNHGIFLVVVVVFLTAFGILPSWSWLQLPYYLLAAASLALGLGWLLSSLTVFVRDVAQIVSIVLGFLVWVTPVFWNIKTSNGVVGLIGRLNPVSYLTEGYRDCFLYGRGFWEDPSWAVYFWGITLVFLGIGGLVFRRLRPHFADVL
jgi:lipopolysaccharide transport system permease protein/teichoic acid transport system permease protein